MPTYTDSYLSPLATPYREDRAAAEVDALGAFPTTPVDWRDRLITLRVYIVICLESMKAPDDIFTAKLKAYRTEWEAALAQAKAATPVDPEGYPRQVFSVDLERG